MLQQKQRLLPTECGFSASTPPMAAWNANWYKGREKQAQEWVGGGGVCLQAKLCFIVEILEYMVMVVWN